VLDRLLVLILALQDDGQRGVSQRIILVDCQRFLQLGDRLVELAS